MTYEDLSNRSVEQGLQVLFDYTSDVTRGWFIIFFLLLIYVVIMIGLYNSQLSRNGRASIPQCSSASGFIVSIISGLLLMIGLVSPVMFGFVLGITLLSVLWLFFSDDE